MIVTGAQTGIFQGSQGFLEEGQVNTHFIFDTRKNDCAGKNILHVLELFLFLEEFQPEGS